VKLPPEIWAWVTTGNAPQYLVFVGAVAAAIVALMNARATRRNAEAAHLQIARLNQQDAQEQASSLSIWLAGWEYWKESPAVVEGKREALQVEDGVDLPPEWYPNGFIVRIFVRNPTDQGLYNVWVYTVNEELGDGKRWLLGRIKYVPPGQSVAVEMRSYVFMEGGLWRGPTDGLTIPVGVLCTDSQGRIWHRSELGDLNQIESSELDQLVGEARSSNRAATRVVLPVAEWMPYWFNVADE
jgi:hypothetical protein